MPKGVTQKTRYIIHKDDFFKVARPFEGSRLTKGTVSSAVHAIMEEVEWANRENPEEVVIVETIEV